MDYSEIKNLPKDLIDPFEIYGRTETNEGKSLEEILKTCLENGANTVEIRNVINGIELGRLDLAVKIDPDNERRFSSANLTKDKIFNFTVKVVRSEMTFDFIQAIYGKSLLSGTKILSFCEEMKNYEVVNTTKLTD